MKIYHNPRCRKSRETLTLLKEQGATPEVIEYLHQPPSKSELTQILSKLGFKAEELIRRNEAIYKASYKGKNLSEDQWIDVMIEHPILIERPIVVFGDKAALGRPPEQVLTIL